MLELCSETRRSVMKTCFNSLTLSPMLVTFMDRRVFERVLNAIADVRLLVIFGLCTVCSFTFRIIQQPSATDCAYSSSIEQSCSSEHRSLPSPCFLQPSLQTSTASSSSLDSSSVRPIELQHSYIFVAFIFKHYPFKWNLEIFLLRATST